MFCIEVFCEIICEIFFTWIPMYIEKFALNLIGYPEETHFHCTRTLFFDRIICNAGSCGIVTMDWCGRLRMPEFFENESDDFSFRGS